MPYSFTHRFPLAGSHLVSVILEVDPPVGERPEGYVVRDHLPADNRQDYALEVLTALPVLLVDGETNPAARERSVDYLLKALTPANDPTPDVQARAISITEFDPNVLLGQNIRRSSSLEKRLRPG